MINPFNFARLPLIIFGSGKISSLPDLIMRYGQTLLLVTGKSSFVRSAQTAGIIKSFKERGFKVHQVTVPGEPSPELVDGAVKRFADTPVDVVVSIGGGSVLDAGKAISAMLYRKESVKAFLEVVGDREHPGTKVPFIAVPTTSGTGSETTKNAVLSSVGPRGFKRSLRHDNFVPDVALVDPQLTVSCPPDITAAAGMDCFTQLVEAYLSTKANPFTDALTMRGIEAIKSNLLTAYIDGDNIDARSGMSFAAMTSGICLANAGLGAVHGIAGTIGAMFSVPHGVVCGTLMAAANEVTLREMRLSGEGAVALNKYSVLGRLISGHERGTDEYFQDAFIGYLHYLTVSLELPRLGRYGLKPDDITTICAVTDSKNNPVKLNEMQLHEIIEQRL
jgi:alcohol dehydrogenase class IV